MAASADTGASRGGSTSGRTDGRSANGENVSAAPDPTDTDHPAGDDQASANTEDESPG